MNLNFILYIVLHSSIDVLSSNQSCWLHEFTHCLLNVAFTNTIILIVDTKNFLYKDQPRQLMLHISQIFPTLLVSLEDKDFVAFDKAQSYFMPSSTLHIYPVVITDKLKPKILIRNVMTVYGDFIRLKEMPKFIVVLFCSSKTSSRFIKTVLEMIYNKTGIDDKYLRIVNVTMNNTKSNISILPSRPRPVAHMPEYNPYTRLWTISNLSSVKEVFPVAIKNLHGRQLKLLLWSSIPILDVKLNSEGCADPNTLAGPQGLILKSLAQSSNFTWKIFFTQQKRIGKIIINKKCVIDRNTLRILRLRKADVSANFIWVPFGLETNLNYMQNMAQDFNMVHMVHMRRQEPIVCLAPILRTSDVRLPEEFAGLVIITLIVIGIVKVAIHLLKIDSQLWSAGNIFSAILGIEIMKVQSIAERILLTGMIIVSVVHSATIMDLLINIQLNINSEIRLTAWNQLDETKLTFMISDVFQEFLMFTGIPLLQELAKKAITSQIRNTTTNKGTPMLVHDNVDTTCLENLVMKSYKNISCLARLTNAEHQVRLSALKYGSAEITILKEKLINLWLVIPVNPFLPYVKRFEQVIQYLTETGLIEKWYQTELILKEEERNILRKSIADENIESPINMIIKLLMVSTIGYILSFSVFLLEIMVNWLKKKGSIIPNKCSIIFRKIINTSKMKFIFGFTKKRKKTLNLCHYY